MTYNDGAVTLEEYRASWAANLSDPGYRAILSSTGAYHTWDDHEVVDSADYYDVPAAQLATAYDTYFENLPVEAIDRGGARTIWTDYQWGDSVDFIVLDSRSERDPDSAATPDAQYISDAQMAFLRDRLMNSTARFKVVLNSVPIANLPIPPWAFEFDRWQGYAAQRDELIAFIRDNGIEDVWFLTGDFHLGLRGPRRARRAGRAGHPGRSRSAPAARAPATRSPRSSRRARSRSRRPSRASSSPTGRPCAAPRPRSTSTPGAGTVRVVFRDPETNMPFYDEIFFVE